MLTGSHLGGSSWVGQGLGLCIQSFIHSLPYDRQENWVSMTNPTKAMIPWSGMSLRGQSSTRALLRAAQFRGSKQASPLRTFDISLITALSSSPPLLFQPHISSTGGPNLAWRVSLCTTVVFKLLEGKKTFLKKKSINGTSNIYNDDG